MTDEEYVESIRTDPFIAQSFLLRLRLGRETDGSRGPVLCPRNGAAWHLVHEVHGRDPADFVETLFLRLEEPGTSRGHGGRSLLPAGSDPWTGRFSLSGGEMLEVVRKAVPHARLTRDARAIRIPFEDYKTLRSLLRVLAPFSRQPPI